MSIWTTDGKSYRVAKWSTVELLSTSALLTSVVDVRVRLLEYRGLLTSSSIQQVLHDTGVPSVETLIAAKKSMYKRWVFTFYRQASTTAQKLLDHSSRTEG